VNNLRASRKRLTTRQHPRQQHVRRPRREFQNHTRSVSISITSRSSAPTTLRTSSARCCTSTRLRTTTTTRPLTSRRIRIRIPRRQLLHRRHRRDILAVHTTAPEPTKTTTATTRANHRSLIEVHRDLIVPVSIHDRTLHITDHTAHNAAAREQAVRLLDRHAGREIVARHYRRRRSFDDQRSALPHEVVEVLHAFESHPATNVVRRVGCAECLELRGLPVRKRRRTVLRDPVHHRLHGTTDVREDYHVVLLAQVAFTKIDVAEVRVRNAVSV